MNGTMRYRKATCLLFGLLVTLPEMAVGGRAVELTVKVTVVAPPPCIINDNKNIAVEFGDVVTSQVDGRNYLREVNYTMSCSVNASNALKLQVTGIGATFDDTVLWTTRNGLGVKLLQGSTKLPINTWLNFTYPTPPVLSAVLVKQPGATLTGGEFGAGAIMKVDYQ